MSVTSLDFQNQYTTDGVSFSYPFTWTTISQNEVTVYLNNVAQVLGTNFTVQLNPTGIGGTITFLTIPAANQALLIQRVDDFLQPNNFGNNQALPPQTLVQMFDKLTIMCQQLLQQSTLSLALSLPAAAVGVNATLPFPVVAGSLIAWDDAATGTAYVDPVEAGYVLTDNGIGNLPSFQAPTGGGGGGGGGTVNTNPASLPTFTGELAIYNGTLGTVIAGAGANGAAGTVLTSTGAAAVPQWQPVTAPLLKAFNVPATANEFPTSGFVPSGTYLQGGLWIQSGNLTLGRDVRVYHNGASFTFVNGFTCTFSNAAKDYDNAGYGAAGNLYSGSNGGGPGGGFAAVAYASNNVGGAGGGSGIYNDSGIAQGGAASNSAGTLNSENGYPYDFRCYPGGSGGAGGNTTTTNSGTAGVGGNRFYLETTGSISFSNITNVPCINVSGASSGGSGGSPGSGGGGGGGSIICIAANTIANGNGTNTLQANGGNGGTSTTGGPGGGGAAGLIVLMAGGAITATGFKAVAGVAGGGSGGSASSGGANTPQIFANTTVRSLL
jgi:hypothetical protein